MGDGEWVVKKQFKCRCFNLLYC